MMARTVYGSHPGTSRCMPGKVICTGAGIVPPAPDTCRTPGVGQPRAGSLLTSASQKPCVGGEWKLTVADGAAPGGGTEIRPETGETVIRSSSRLTPVTAGALWFEKDGSALAAGPRAML